MLAPTRCVVNAAARQQHGSHLAKPAVSGRGELFFGERRHLGGRIWHLAKSSSRVDADFRNHAMHPKSLRQDARDSRQDGLTTTHFIQDRSEHRTSNAELPTLNRKEKDESFSLLLSPLPFGVRRSKWNAERALASLEKSGEALTGIAGGNVRCCY
jgi:hypothetical protein